jgi:hypothetical protein
MVPPDGTTYLTPAPGSGASTDAGAKEGDSTSGTAAASNDDAAAWPLIKPYLGATP